MFLNFNIFNFNYKIFRISKVKILKLFYFFYFLLYQKIIRFLYTNVLAIPKSYIVP